VGSARASRPAPDAQCQAETTAAALQLQHFFSHQLREESFLTACAPVSGEKTAETQLHAW